ncbi:MAG: NAD(P)/FAD-dependent oxidoreductase, partial [Gemmatimonadetes bacterium]|nr:NAD(P)/FAD-dependent oxidoreductase [Gemmatimonadota bacterium]
PRLSRIYYRDRFFDSPLRPGNALRGLGPVESIRIVASYLKARGFPNSNERTFEDWVVNRFGRRLYEIFFETYTEKVWGIPCSEIGAEWAAQRIKNLNLTQAIKHALLGGRTGGSVITTLIDEFQYPRLGPGMMWERWCERLEARGVRTHLEAEVVELHHRDGRVEAVTVRFGDGRTERVSADHFVSTMPARQLVHSLDPPAPEPVVAAADKLKYRDFLTVVLIVRDAEVFPDNWIYIHSPNVKVGRIQNFKNWSPEMVPDPSTTSLGLEYFVNEGDDLWSAPDTALVELGETEMIRLGLIRPETLIDGTVVRMPKAYPVYDSHYEEALATVRGYTSSLTNLHLIGRNGQHRYNNQDHSMLTGIYAARNIDGADYDVWSVNVESEYHEEKRELDTGKRVRVADRLTPSVAADETLEGVLAAAFARYDSLALGLAVAIVSGVGLFLATAWVLLRAERDSAEMLALIGQYLLGYEVSWGGAVLGFMGAGLFGFVVGFGVGWLINLIIGWEETILEHELEIAGTIDPLNLE